MTSTSPAPSRAAEIQAYLVEHDLEALLKVGHAPTLHSMVASAGR